jgi:hypothetical protein
MSVYTRPQVGDVITLTASSEALYHLRIFEKWPGHSYGVVPYAFVGRARVSAVDSARMVVERVAPADQPPVIP